VSTRSDALEQIESRRARKQRRKDTERAQRDATLTRAKAGDKLARQRRAATKRARYGSSRKPAPVIVRSLGEATRAKPGSLGAETPGAWDRAGLTQVEAGEAIHVRSQFVSEVENGRRGMRWDTLRALLRAYGATLADLGAILGD
jgi:DNA-binding XRE family transcriptional regulator